MKKNNARAVCFVMAFILSLQIVFPTVQINAMDDLSSSSIAVSEATPPSSVADSQEETQSSLILSAPASSSNPPSSTASAQSNTSNHSSARTDKTSHLSSPVSSFIWTDAMSATVDNACKWLTLNSTDKRYLLVMGIAGKSADIAVTTREQQEIAQKEGNYDNPNDLSLDILTLVFSGMNPENFQGLNLIKNLYEYQNLSSMDAVANILALIAFDSNQFSIPDSAFNTRDSIVQSLLQLQQENGSFVFNGEESFEITAIAVSALAPYQDQENVRTSIQSALSYLQNQLKQTQNFNCYTLSCLTIAVSSLGISVNDRRFASRDESLVDSIMQYQLSNGSFTVDEDTEQADVIATELAIIAMIAAQNQESPFILQNGIAYEQQNESSSVPLIFICMIVAVFLIAASLICIFVMKRKKKQECLNEKANQKKNDDQHSTPNKH